MGRLNRCRLALGRATVIPRRRFNTRNGGCADGGDGHRFLFLLGCWLEGSGPGVIAPYAVNRSVEAEKKSKFSKRDLTNRRI